MIWQIFILLGALVAHAEPVLTTVETNPPATDRADLSRETASLLQQGTDNANETIRQLYPQAVQLSLSPNPEERKAARDLFKQIESLSRQVAVNEKLKQDQKNQYIDLTQDTNGSQILGNPTMPALDPSIKEQLAMKGIDAREVERLASQGHFSLISELLVPSAEGFSGEEEAAATDIALGRLRNAQSHGVALDAAPTEAVITVPDVSVPQALTSALSEPTLNDEELKDAGIKSPTPGMNIFNWGHFRYLTWNEMKDR